LFLSSCIPYVRDYRLWLNKNQKTKSPRPPHPSFGPAPAQRKGAEVVGLMISANRPGTDGPVNAWRRVHGLHEDRRFPLVPPGQTLRPSAAFRSIPASIATTTKLPRPVR